MQEQYGSAYTGAQIDSAVGKILNFDEANFIGPQGPQGPDGNPIGTVISFMGTQAPKSYLICDGNVYNSADYPALAQFFTEQFGAANYFGCGYNDETGEEVEGTFAVPNLIGYFLRGADLGSGPQHAPEDAAGRQGEGTEIPYIFTDGDNCLRIPVDTRGVTPIMPLKSSTKRPHAEEYKIIDVYSLDGSEAPVPNAPSLTDQQYYRAIPPYCNVLYCIKAVESVPKENVYSTEETRIGTWIDGKPLYRKVLDVTSPPSTDITSVADVSGLSINTVTNLYGIMTAIYENGTKDFLYCNYYFGEGDHSFISTNGNEVYIKSVNPNQSVNIIIEYTKTTD